ncbi:MAG: polysaccharide synthesis protein GtrA [Burkholderiales bacterium PBB4]|nr:MAG: polysaccharide synthesis protein GtrA [Burkholderiales bacterium PBB4]
MTLSQRVLNLLAWLSQFRYFKFGIVGASGTVVNIAVLKIAQTYIFNGIESAKIQLALSLILAIFVATLSNFTWNRLWTWADRQDALAVDLGAPKAPRPERLTIQFGRYCAASWFGMAFQFVVTIWLSHYMVDWLANVISIVAASVINFLANDRWTFKVRPKP